MEIIDHVAELIFLANETDLIELELIFEFTNQPFSVGDFFFWGVLKVSIVFSSPSELHIEAVYLFFKSIFLVDEVSDLFCWIFGQIDVFLFLIVDHIVQMFDIFFLSCDDVLQSVGLSFESGAEVF